MTTISNQSATPAAVRALRTTRVPLSTPRSTTSTRREISYSNIKASIILDLGSTIWKVGVAGEVKPRTCLRNQIEFKLNLEEEEEALMKHRIMVELRKLWIKDIGIDSKTRNIVLLESPLLPIPVKEMITSILFQNLQVPTVSYVSSGLMALMAVGKVTGLVLDCGNSQTTILSIYASRPLNHHLLTTPIAANRLSIRLKGLLLQFGSYIPPPPMTNSPPPAAIKIPLSVLTNDLIEEIKTRLLFIGDPLPPSELVVPSRDAILDSIYDETEDIDFLNYLEQKFSCTSTANSITMKISNFGQAPTVSGVGKGWIVTPGWIRERAAEVFFEKGNEDEINLPEIVLSSLLSLPIDLRKPLISSILITGGTTMLPGFLPRLELELQSLLTPSSLPNLFTTNDENISLARAQLSNRLQQLRSASTYRILEPLKENLKILGLKNGILEGGFSPHLASWVGASLASEIGLVGVDLKRREDWIS